eukprot:gb/GECG01000515.1/.p1 GENE.gb/GECG01000515.1/~~gb/GECG01000515.1/.p1  ORF type:complete len:376 (+),score=68.98 gb/GECG01000515.1/:1-1128(+)
MSQEDNTTVKYTNPSPPPPRTTNVEENGSTDSPRRRTGGGYALSSENQENVSPHAKKLKFRGSPSKEKHHKNTPVAKIAERRRNKLQRGNVEDIEAVVAGNRYHRESSSEGQKPSTEEVKSRPGHEIASSYDSELFARPSKDHVSFIVDPKRDSNLMARGEMPYFLQGDDAMYTQGAVEQRNKLYSNPILRTEIRNVARKLNWIDDPAMEEYPIELRNSVLSDPNQSSNVPAPTPFPGVGKVLPFEEYKRMYRYFIRVLRPEAAVNDLDRHLEMDWMRDSERERLEIDKPATRNRPVKSAPAAANRQYQPHYVTWKQFYDAVFEIVDQWCQSTKLIEYRALLKALQDTLPDIDQEADEHGEGHEQENDSKVDHET